MSNSIAINYETPLIWPGFQAKTPRGRQNNLNGFPPTLTLNDAMRYIDEEVQPLAPIKATITSHVEYLNNERLRAKEIGNPAVSLKLRLGENNYIFACDRWLLITHNLYAISATLRQLRQIAQFGTADASQLLYPYLMQQPTAAAAPVTAGASENWMIALGLGNSATLEDANAVYRGRAKVLHDHPEKLMELNASIEAARHYFGSKG